MEIRRAPFTQVEARLIECRFPYKIGYDCAGQVTAVGDRVVKFKVGDSVYVRLPESHRGMATVSSVICL